MKTIIASLVEAAESHEKLNNALKDAESCIGPLLITPHIDYKTFSIHAVVNGKSVVFADIVIREDGEFELMNKTFSMDEKEAIKSLFELPIGGGSDA